MCIVCQGVAIAVSVLTPIVPGLAVEQGEHTQRAGAPAAAKVMHVAEGSAAAEVAKAAVDAAPAISGTTCRKAGTTRVIGKSTYICATSARGLRWIPRSVAAKSSTTTTLPRAAGHFKATCGYGNTACPATSPQISDVSQCKIADFTYEMWGAAQGFPRPSRAKVGKPVLNIMVFPIRYRGMTISEATLRSRFEKEFSDTRDFMSRNSYGRVQLNFTIPPATEWPQVDVSPQEFVSTRGADLLRVTQDALNLITRTDLATFDSIFVVAADSEWYFGGGGGIYEHPSGQLHGVYFQTGPASMANFPHNLGHTAFYFEDLYLHPYARTGPNVDIFPLKYDTMSTGTDYSGWNRWLAGFLLDSDITCLPDTNVTTVHRITHINRAQGQRLVVLPLAPGKALFAEYVDNALHIYELNSFINHGAGPLKTLGTVGVGEVFAHENFRFKIVAADFESIYVEIQR